jgi:hypothetical protein
MKERSEQDRHAGDAARARRKRIAEGVARVIMLLAGSFWLWVFIMAVRTGYLSWIGLTVGAVFVGSLLSEPLLGWTGRKRLAIGALGIHFGLIGLFLLAAMTTFLCPQDKGTWHPYRFDQELAAIEAKRAVPEAENAARRYETAFAGMDLGDEPNCVFASSLSLRDELDPRPWRTDEHPQASAWLDSQSALIDRLLEIGRMEKCRWPVQADTYDEHTVPYKKLRRSMLLLMAAGNRDLGEGRVTDALTKYFCTLHVADHIHQQPSMVDTMTGFGCERDGLRMIRYVLVQSSLSDENIAVIAKHLPAAADPWPKEWERLLELEKLHYMNLLGRLYEVNEDGTVRFTMCPTISPEEAKDAPGLPRPYWLMSMPRDPHAVRGLVNAYFAKFDSQIVSADMPQMGMDERFSTSAVNASRAACNFYRWWAETCFFNEPAYVEHRHWRVPAITLRRGTWLVLGLRRYRDTHGA